MLILSFIAIGEKIKFSRKFLKFTVSCRKYAHLHLIVPLKSIKYSYTHWWKFKIYKNWPLEIQILKLAIGLQILIIFKFKWSIVFRLTENISGKLRYNQPNSAFWGWFSKEIQPQNPEFRNNPENFHPWTQVKIYWIYLRTYATKYFPYWNIFNTLHTVCFMHGLSIYQIKRICHRA